MKKLYIWVSALCFVLLHFPLHAQQQVLPDLNAQVVYEPFQRPSGGADFLCTTDTIAYTQQKAVGLVLLSVNNVSSAQGMYQYYDCPQEMTLYGVSFFAYAPNAANPVNCTVEIYFVTPDTLPMGPPILIDTIAVDSSHGLFTLAELQYRAQFTNPLTLNQPFIIVFANRSGTNVSIVNSDYTTADGDQEWLSGADFRHQSGGTWTRGYDVNVGAVPFDADVLLMPWLQYNLEAVFYADSTCLTNTDTVCFTNVSSPVMFHRMYNFYAYLNLLNSSFAWDYGDFSGLQYNVEACHGYPTNGPFTVQLYANLYGWYSSCGASGSVTVGDPGLPIPAFNTTISGITVDFNNISSGAATTNWDFGDGGTSSAFSPTHIYAGNGSYPISLIVTNGCGADTLLDTVIINCVPPVADFNWTNTFLSVTFTNASTSGTSYLWTFGDGGTSMLNNPNHVYPAYGGYLATLIVYSNCGNDTIRDSVIITQPQSINYGSLPWKVTLQPNPATDQTTLDLTQVQAVATITIKSLDGRAHFIRQSQGRESIPLELTNIPAGIYLLEVRTSEGRWTSRLVVSH
jgi:PKD repeat protein